MNFAIHLNNQGIAYLKNNNHLEALAIFRKAASFLHCVCDARDQRELQRKNSPSQKLRENPCKEHIEENTERKNIPSSSVAKPEARAATTENNEENGTSSPPRNTTGNKRRRVDGGSKKLENVNEQDDSKNPATIVAGRRAKRARFLPPHEAMTEPPPLEESGFLWCRPFSLRLEDQGDDGSKPITKTNSIEEDIDHPDWITLSVIVLFNMALTYQLSCCSRLSSKRLASAAQNAGILYYMSLDFASVRHVLKRDKEEEEEEEKEPKNPLLDIVVMASLNNTGVLKREQEADHPSAQRFFEYLSIYALRACRKQRRRRNQEQQRSEVDGNRAAMNQLLFKDDVYHYFMLNSMVLRNKPQGAEAA